MILRMMTIGVAVLLLAGVTARAQTQSGQAAGAAMDEFRALVTAHEDAMNRKDADGVAATFTTTADQIFFDQPRLIGRDAIRDQLRSIFAAPQTFERFKLTVTSARLLSPNMAIVETDATFTGAPEMANRGTMVVVRHQGRWLIESLRVYPALAVKR